VVGRPHTAVKHLVPLKHLVEDHLNVLSERELGQPFLIHEGVNGNEASCNTG